MNATKKFVDLFTSTEEFALPAEPIQVCGRISNGHHSNPEHFETLSLRPDEKTVFAMGPSGLHKLLEIKLKNIRQNELSTLCEILVCLGINKEIVAHKLKQGYTYELILFPIASSEEATSISGSSSPQVKVEPLLATWHNVLTLTKQTFPDVYPFVLKHMDALKSTPFKQIQQDADFDFHEVRLAGVSHPKHMKYNRFKELFLDGSGNEPTLLDVRSFLYFEMSLRELYSGDGYTYDNKGVRGVEEFFIMNVKRSLVQGQAVFYDLTEHIYKSIGQNHEAFLELLASTLQQL